MRHSNQRDIILNELCSRHDHPTANDIYESVRVILPNISLGTVYRNLNQLADNGIILRLPQPDSSNRFDGKSVRHYHLCCKQCGSITDIDSTILDDFFGVIMSKYSFEADCSGMTISGICSKCRNN
ncbi:MAG: transcriptional repressor [Acutalibacteraceae bacterium]